MVDAPIAGVRTYRLAARLWEPIGTPHGKTYRRESLLVAVDTADGRTGWGECGGFPEAAEALIKERLAPILFGQCALNHERLWQAMWLAAQPHGRRGAMMGAISGLDMAIWDLRARTLGIRAGDLFGGIHREKLPCAAIGLYSIDGPEVERIPRLVDEARALVDNGYRAIAVQIGRNLTQDKALIAGLRAALPETAFTAEAHGAYDLPEAIAIGRLLEENRFSVFEDPVPADMPDLYTHLAAAVRMPLAAGRLLQTRTEFENLLRTRCVHVAHVHLAWCGGPTEALRIRALASAHGINVSPIATGNAVGVAAAMHFLATDIRQPGRTEAPPPLLRRDGLRDPLRDHLAGGILRLEDGLMTIPKGAGWGIEPDLEAIERHIVTTQKLTPSTILP